MLARSTSSRVVLAMLRKVGIPGHVVQVQPRSNFNIMMIMILGLDEPSSFRVHWCTLLVLFKLEFRLHISLSNCKQYPGTRVPYFDLLVRNLAKFQQSARGRGCIDERSTGMTVSESVARPPTDWLRHPYAHTCRGEPVSRRYVFLRTDSTFSGITSTSSSSQRYGESQCSTFSEAAWNSYTVTVYVCFKSQTWALGEIAEMPPSGRTRSACNCTTRPAPQAAFQVLTKFAF